MRRFETATKWTLLVLFLTYHCASFATDAGLDFDKDAKPFLDAYCIKCHNAEKAKGGVRVDVIKNEIGLYRYRERVEDIIGELTKKEMPPEESKQPPDEQRAKLAEWLQWKLDHFDTVRFHNPGYLPSHHLTRTQYRNTIRDLIGVGMEIADDLPVDEATFGFDQIGDVQEVSPVHMEKYIDAATYILDRVFIPPAKQWHFEAKKLPYIRAFGMTEDDQKVEFPKDAPEHLATDHDHVIYFTGGVMLSHYFPYTGTYRFKFRIWGDKAQDAKHGPSVSVKLDSNRAGEFGVPTGGPKKIEEPTVSFIVRAGQHDIKLDMTGMGVNMKATDPAKQFNCFAVESIDINGPVAENEVKAKEIRQKIVSAQPASDIPPREAARKIYTQFAPRAYRRPVTSEEIESLLGFFDRALAHGATFENAVKLGLKVILVSPDFLFHIEKDRNVRDAYRIGDFELANRLSYFIWSSMPDSELSALAEQGKLHEPEILQAQTRRMLKDPKSRALAENFAPQWLNLGSLFAVAREGKFHNNNRGEREPMLEEVVRFFDYVLREDRPITDLLNADYTFVNKKLAEHYGIPGLKTPEFQRVVLTGDLARKRGGVLGMAAVHLAISHPKDTNPSGRGKWVLDILLGTPPPPPPANVPPLPKEEKDGAKLTLRERLAIHRSDSNCAGCHAKIDPIGFALENFDTVGAWRDTENGKLLDVSGQLPGGKSINGFLDLRTYLATEKRGLFIRNFSKRLLTFALRRGLEYYDEETLREMQAALDKNHDQLSALVVSVVSSYPFQYRQNPDQETR